MRGERTTAQDSFLRASADVPPDYIRPAWDMAHSAMARAEEVATYAVSAIADNDAAIREIRERLTDLDARFEHRIRGIWTHLNTESDTSPIPALDPVKLGIAQAFRAWNSDDYDHATVAALRSAWRSLHGSWDRQGGEIDRDIRTYGLEGL